MTNQLNKKEIHLIKKALRICIIKFDVQGRLRNDTDSKILSNKFDRVYDRIRYLQGAK